METTTNFASDALFVLDAIGTTMARDDGGCGSPFPNSPKIPHNGLLPSTPIIAPASVDEELSGLASELPQESLGCVLYDEPKRPPSS